MMTGSKAEVESYETSASEHDGMFIASLVQTPAASVPHRHWMTALRMTAVCLKIKSDEQTNYLRVHRKKQKGDNN